MNHNLAFPPAGISELPPQAIPTKKKDDKWKSACMDALERIGVKQIRDKAPLLDFDRLMRGDMAFMTVSQYLPHLENFTEFLGNNGVPTYLRPYDPISPIINAFMGFLGNSVDKYFVTSTDEVETNQLIETKSLLLTNYLSEYWQRMLQLKMINMGIDPYFNDFDTEEERQAYVQQIESLQQTLTPPEIQSSLETKFRTAATMWGDQVLKSDRYKFDIDNLDKDNFIDYLSRGRMFRHYHVGPDYYKAETWWDKETFYSITQDVRFPQYGEYIGRVHLYDSGQILSRWGQKLTAEQKETLTNYDGWWGADGRSDVYGSYNHKKIRPSQWTNSPFYQMNEERWVPFKNYDEYQSIVAVEDYTGSPLGRQISFNEKGEKTITARYMPRIGNVNKSSGGLRYALTDEPVKPNLFQVTEAYWVSYEPIYHVTYQTETGRVVQEIVTDELYKDFFKEYELKKRKLSVEEALTKPEVNTYIEDYRPIVYYGVKISGGNLSGGSICLADPIPHQIKGDSDMYDTVLPVAGFCGEALMKKLEPFYLLHNIACNQAYNLLEKEIGVFFLFDVTFLPSEYAGFKNEDAFEQLMTVAKNVGAFSLDMSHRNGSGNSNFNQFAVYDLSLTKQINERITVADWAKAKLYEMVGITPQALGQASPYESATGIQQGAAATSIQTYTYFDNFDTFKRKAADIHLAVAQACQEEGKDITIQYTMSDTSREFITIGTDGLSLRHLGVMQINNSKKRQELEFSKQLLYQMNQAGLNFEDYTSIVACDSMLELKQLGRQSSDRIERKTQQQNEFLLQQQREKAQLDNDLEDKKQRNVLDQIALKGEMNIRRDSVRASGSAASKDADQLSLNFVEEMTEKALEGDRIEADTTIRNRKLDLEEKKINNQIATKQAEIELRDRQLQQQERNNQSQEFRAIINKN